MILNSLNLTFLKLKFFKISFRGGEDERIFEFIPQSEHKQKKKAERIGKRRRINKINFKRKTGQLKLNVFYKILKHNKQKINNIRYNRAKIKF